MRKKKASLSLFSFNHWILFFTISENPTAKKRFDFYSVWPPYSDPWGLLPWWTLFYTITRAEQPLKCYQPVLDFEFSSRDVQINSSSFATGREHASIFRVCGSWTPNFWEVTVHIQHLQLAQESKRESSLLLSELQRCLTFSVWPSKGSVEFDPFLCSSFHPFSLTCQVCDYHCTLLSRIILKWLCEPMGWKLRSIPPLILKNPFHLVDFFNSALPGFFFKDFFPSPSVNYAGYSELQTCAETLER